MKSQLRVSLLSLGLIAVGILLPAVVQGENILNTVWYKSLPAVDADSDEFKSKVDWITGKVGLAAPLLHAETYADSTMLAPYELIFKCTNGKTATTDAVMAYVSPTTAVTDIQTACGLEKVNPGSYVAPAPKPAKVKAPAKPKVPVGDLIPGTKNHYQPVAGDTSAAGTKYKDARGSFMKVSVPSLMGAPSVYWLKK